MDSSDVNYCTDIAMNAAVQTDDQTKNNKEWKKLEILSDSQSHLGFLISHILIIEDKIRGKRRGVKKHMIPIS